MENKKYWKGLEELHEDPAFVAKKHDEFKEELPLEEIFNTSVNAPSGRRDFLKKLGFSAAAVTVAASCKNEVRKAIPYVIKPEEITPGIANWYASTYADGGDYCSILVKCREGRPIKIEGNDLSSISRGGTNARVQASVLSLYDNSRLAGPKKDGKKASWADVDKEIMSGLGASSNVRILTSSIISPSTKMVVNEFIANNPGAKHITYDAISYSGMIMANEESFGKRAVPSYRFDKANVIASFDADFIGTWLSPVEFTKQYIKKRKVNSKNAKMSRHFQVESRLSLTGSNADERVAIRPSEVGVALLNLYNNIARMAGAPTANGVAKLERAEALLNDAASELWANKGSSLVVCGSNNKHHQVITNAINELLGNYGKTIDIDRYAWYKQGMDSDVQDLIKEMKGGGVDALLIHNVNPAYDLPNGGEFAEAMGKVKLSVSFNDKEDETTVNAKYMCPDNHFLESWDDAMPVMGYYSIGQPTIATVLDTRQWQDSLLKWMGKGGDDDYYAYIRKYWKDTLFPMQNKYSEFNTFWDKSVHDGVFEVSNGSHAAEMTDAGGVVAAPPADDAEAPIASSEGGIDAAAAAIKKASGGEMELVVYEKIGIGNGKEANNPWLQEMPDPISKVTWDNYAALPQGWANANDIKDGDMVTVEANNHSVIVPAVIQAGQNNNTVSIALGYGRMKAGVAGNGIGKNAYPFTSFDGTTMYGASTVTVTRAEGEEWLAQTQTHHHFEGRPIIKETTLDAYKANPAAGNEDRQKLKEYVAKNTIYPEAQSQYKYPVEKEGDHGHDNHGDGHEKSATPTEYKTKGIHWGMVVDLNSCIGCSNCIVACNAENNVPVVGKNEVRRAHELHWMRIDRYYSFKDENGETVNKEETLKEIKNSGKEMDYSNVEVVYQPMICQHCDNAPCENVCPVSATNHSSEGLNQMAYNRCVGTRYCENNCPYKVRRFNWYDYTSTDSFGTLNDSFMDEQFAQEYMLEDLTRMVLNPDVTVRSRGVMEKCSFCVQRLQDGKLTAKKENRKLKDGDIKTACQQSCPSEAIVFGDLNDKESEVAMMWEDERAYHVLEAIHTLPSVSYLTKVRNKKA